jgi:hypothetical protein
MEMIWELMARKMILFFYFSENYRDLHQIFIIFILFFNLLFSLHWESIL